MLKESQLKIFNQVIEAIHNKKEKRVILKGAAGTGKTFLTEYIVKYFTDQIGKWEDSKIWVTAPTNKALSVLQRKIAPNKKIEFATTHSALKLYKNIDSVTGVVSFIPPKKNFGDPAFHNCIFAIIDECSMLNTSILEFLEELPFPILFIGDSFQINPVGEEVSPIFHKGFLEFELTEIIRQGEGNPIIDLSRDLNRIWLKQPLIVEEKGYIFSNDKKTIISNLAEINGSDDLKYISWTNKDVELINKLVREKIYNNPGKIEKDELITFKEPFLNYWNNQELKVRDLEVVEKDFSIPTKETTYSTDSWLQTDKISLKVYMINGHIPVIHESSEMEFIKTKKEIATFCRSENWNWKGYYFFLAQFANITYSHAITCHKS